MERIDQQERVLTQQYERHDRRLWALEDHFYIRRSPSPIPTTEEGHIGTSQGPQDADESIDPDSAQP